MEEGFSKQKTHAENIQISVEKILGQKTTLRKVKKTAEEHQKAIFTRIITTMAIADERTLSLDSNFTIDLHKYNGMYEDIIDDLLALHFSKNQINLIYFFLYERFTPDGQVLNLMDENNKKIKLDDTDDLWEIIKKYK